MKAAILTEPGNLNIREAPFPVCPAGGVLVKVKACGICAADAKMVTKGHRALVYPRILGHEIAGIVSQSRTKLFKEGDRVQVAPGLRCGTCSQCRLGAGNQCENREILGFTQNGGFADYVAVPIEGSLVGTLTPIPDHVSYQNATLAEPLACCINAQDKVDVRDGDKVLIIGAGPMGLIHAALARLKGADKVLIAEIDTHRRKVAHLFGAHRAFDPARKEFFEAVTDATGQNGVDVIIFACSEAGLDKNFIKLLAPGGRVSLFSGTSALFSQIKLDLNLIHYHEFVLAGAYGCSADHNRRAVNLIASRKLSLQKIITHQVTLDNIAEGFEYTKSKKNLKSIMEVQNE